MTSSIPSRKVAGLGRGAASFFAFPMSLLKMGIRYAAVFPDPDVMLTRDEVNRTQPTNQSEQCQ